MQTKKSTSVAQKATNSDDIAETESSLIDPTDIERTASADLFISEQQQAQQLGRFVDRDQNGTSELNEGPGHGVEECSSPHAGKKLRNKSPKRRRSLFSSQGVLLPLQCYSLCKVSTSCLDHIRRVTHPSDIEELLRKPISQIIQISSSYAKACDSPSWTSSRHGICFHPTIQPASKQKVINPQMPSLAELNPSRLG